MCIIVAKPKGVDLPSKETLRECFRGNPDGAGFMYQDKDKKKVIFKKGYMGFRRFYRDIMRTLEQGDVSMVMHFRITTHGGTSQANTHPFPISSNESDLIKLGGITDIAMAHNGIISGYTDVKAPTLSDTQLFIRDYVSVFKELNTDFYKNERVLDMLDTEARSKLCFLDKDGDITIVGNFINDNGVLYSNGTYKSYAPTHVSPYRGYTGYVHNRYEYEDDADDINEDRLYDRTYDDDTIDYDNYMTIDPGMTVEVAYNNYQFVDYEDEHKYCVDGKGNFCTLLNGFPCEIIAKNVTVFSDKWEEIIF